MLLRRHKNRLETPVEEVKEEVVEEVEKPKYEAPNLEDKTLNELRKLGQEYKVKGYNTMKKKVLIEELTKILG